MRGKRVFSDKESLLSLRKLQDASPGIKTGSRTDAAESDLQMAAGSPVLLVGTTTASAQSAWINGALAQTSAESYVPSGSDYVNLVLAGAIRRLVVWDRVLTTEELAAASDELVLAHMLATMTISWDAPAFTGGSDVTGYVVRVLSGSTLVETTVLGDVLTAVLQAPPGGYVQVVAVSAAGQGRPAEISA